MRKAEEDISKFEEKGWSHAQSGGRRDSRYHPYKRSDKQTQEQRSGNPAWKTLRCFSQKKGGRPSHHVQPRVSHHINGNYCVKAPVPRQLTQSKDAVKFVNLCQLHRTGHLEQPRDCKLYQCHWTGPVSRDTLKVRQTLINVVNSVVVNHAHTVKGQP